MECKVLNSNGVVVDGSSKLVILYEQLSRLCCRMYKHSYDVRPNVEVFIEIQNPVIKEKLEIISDKYKSIIHGSFVSVSNEELEVLSSAVERAAFI